MRHGLTPTNGVTMKTNGYFVVRIRVLGEPGTHLIGERYKSYEEALAARSAALAGRTPSAVGLTRLEDGWRVRVRFMGRVYSLGDFPTEEAAAHCRCSFDAWAADRYDYEVTAALCRFRK